MEERSASIKALSKKSIPDRLMAAIYRLQALANLHQDEGDIAGFTISLHSKGLKLIDQATFHAAAICPLSLASSFGDVTFDQQQFLDLAL